MSVQISVITVASLPVHGMGIHSTAVWSSLEKRRGQAFVVGGGLLLVNALIHGANAFGGLVTTPELRGLLFGAGFAVIFAGLLGLYPELADRSPRLARSAAVATAAALLLNAVNAVWWVGVLLAPSLPMPGELVPLVVLTSGSMLLGFILFGVASTRTGVPSSAVGWLVLLTPVVAVVGLLLRGFVFVDLPQYSGGVIVLGATSLAVLATGYVLHTGRTPSNDAETSTDSAV